MCLNISILINNHMNYFDMHIHSEVGNIDPADFIQKMNSVGIRGGAVMSPDPESPLGYGVSYETRMDCLKKWTEGHQDTLVPVLYIHPLEKDAVQKAQDAVSRGVQAFKITCDCFYVGDEPSMELLTEIAKMNKPVIFHSGILWNDYDSSKYNRPLNWECLIKIPGLRFSLAHCAWPWCDETIALYGKFLYTYAANPTDSAEMFLDLTPGTPVIYRKDLINKIYNSAYDTPRNVLFGTDCTANHYNFEWAKSWLDRDQKIMNEIGVSESLQQYYFEDNFKRFLGLTKKNFQHISPTPDKADGFSLDLANRTY